MTGYWVDFALNSALVLIRFRCLDVMRFLEFSLRF